MVSVDKDGYLADLTEWNEKVAKDLAGYDGIDNLTEKHWQVIHFIRECKLFCVNG